MRGADTQDDRRKELIENLVGIRWLHDELGLPPIPNGTGSHSFPTELLPNKQNEETPGAYQTYEKLLSKFVTTYKEDDDGVVDLSSLDDLQPEVGLINWINELSGLVSHFNVA